MSKQDYTNYENLRLPEKRGSVSEVVLQRIFILRKSPAMAEMAISTMELSDKNPHNKAVVSNWAVRRPEVWAQNSDYLKTVVDLPEQSMPEVSIKDEMKLGEPINPTANQAYLESMIADNTSEVSDALARVYEIHDRTNDQPGFREAA